MDGLDTARLESFRQLRKEIRGSNEHLVVGVDVATPPDRKHKRNILYG